MSELTPLQKDQYEREANHHADFLCDKVFHPAFVMAFIHGAKHGRDDVHLEEEAKRRQ